MRVDIQRTAADFTPRHYQVSGYNNACIELRKPNVRGTTVVLPTGTGKTFLFSWFAKNIIKFGGRVLILAHRDELIRQAAEDLVSMGLEPAIEKAEERAQSASVFGNPSCVVASVQTLRGKRLQEWDRDYFKLIVIDECHHAPSPTYRNIFNHFESAKRLGVTATLDRLDKKGYLGIFDSVAYSYPLPQAIQEGFLCRLEVVRCETSVDLKDVRVSKEDLNESDLALAITPHITELVNVIIPEIGDRKTIVFTPDVGSAEATASALRSLGITAESVSGDDPHRHEKIKNYRNQKYQVLVNCSIATEGTNFPFVSAIVLMRPTKSRSFYTQCVGRGTRTYPGKTSCLIIDFAWLSANLKLVGPIDLMGDGVSKEVRAKAQKMLDDGDEVDLMDAVEKATREEAEEKEKKRRDKIDVKAKRKKVKYRRVAYDPFDVETTIGMEAPPAHVKNDVTPATERQIAALERFGVTNPASASKAMAAAMLDKLFERRNAGLASHKQVRLLMRFGYPADGVRSLTKEEASEMISAKLGKREQQGAATA